MPSVADPTSLVGTAIDEAICAVERHGDLAGPEVVTLVDGARRALVGGKRMRAQLCLEASAACGAPPRSAEDPVVRAAAALEIFQAAALVHDDLMDDSDTRRGAPSAHRWFAGQVPPGVTQAGAERNEAFGAAGAILLGDLLLTLSATTLLGAVAELPPPVQRHVREIYDAMSAEVAFGQYLDLVAAHSHWGADSGLDRAWRVVTSKTARYSVELPLALGARIAAGGDDVVAWLERIGRHIGIAFQLRDDLLGVFGDPAVTGKPAGDDLREGKRTVLIALAHQAADGEQRRLLETHLGSPSLDATHTEALREVLVGTGARDAVEHLIDEHTGSARTLLARPPAGVGATERLARLLQAAVDRTA